MIKKYKNFLNENNNKETFKQWFGNSKVVDDQDKPLIVYHGTSDDIDTFSEEFGGNNTGNNVVGGFYFTSVYEVAEDYGRQSYIRKNYQWGDRNDLSNVEEEAENHIKVLDVYLKMENPLILKSTDGHVDIDKTDRYINFIKNEIDEDGDIWQEFYEKGVYNEDDVESNREEIEEFVRDMYGLDEDEEIGEEQFNDAIDEFANQTGMMEKELPTYDGIIWHNVYDSISDMSAWVQDVFIVINPKQIKSATNNSGHYNIYSNNIYEYAEYHNLHGDDSHEITHIVRDHHHEYKYCDGIVYQLSKEGHDTMVSIDVVEHTEENEFYQDQIDRYVEYIQDGGILETFPVGEMPLGSAFNLQEMCDYLGESENFDTMYDIIKGYKELYDDLDDVAWDSEEKGIKEGLLSLIKNKNDLDEHYGKSYKEEYEDEEYISEDGTLYWKEDYYNGFIAILEYWDDNKEYTLTDMNHRFAALKELGKTMVYVDPS